MNINVFLPMFLFLGGLYLCLGIFVSKKIKTVKDYFLAGRDLGLGALTFTLVATQIGGGMLLGSADAAYTDGYFGVFYTVGMSIGFLLLGCGLASKLRAFDVVTTAQLFETKYGSPFLRKVAGMISALSMIGIFAAQVVASKTLFNVIGIQNEYFLVLFWALVIAYTVVGGLKAVVITDIFQVIFLVSIVSGVFLATIFSKASSLVPIIAETQPVFTSFGAAFFRQLPILITSAIYPLFGQDLTQRFFAARTKKIAVWGSLLAGLSLIVFAFVPVYFGMKAKFLGLAIVPGTSVFYSVVKVLTNNMVLAMVGCALIAAITSTADSLLCAVSSNIVQDFNFDFASERSKLRISKIITFVAGGIGLWIAYFSKNILSVMTQSYNVLICALFVPVLFCFFRNKLSKASAGLAMLGGSAMFVAIKALNLFGGSELALVLVPILMSFIGYIVGNWTKKCSMEEVTQTVMARR